jgi:hypothetical protein
MEEVEEAVASLAANNSLPLFWLALLQEENLGLAWESEVHAAFADADESGMQPIRLGWREAESTSPQPARRPRCASLAYAFRSGIEWPA